MENLQTSKTSNGKIFSQKLANPRGILVSISQKVRTPNKGSSVSITYFFFTSGLEIGWQESQKELDGGSQFIRTVLIRKVEKGG